MSEKKPFLITAKHVTLVAIIIATIAYIYKNYL